MLHIFDEKVLNYIKLNFPVESTSNIAYTLNISPSIVRSIAKKYRINKDPDYIKNIHQTAIATHKRKLEESIKTYSMTDLQRNIIVGSILGDGSLALYGRSKNAYYREHGCIEQLGYRQWKQKNLESLDFKLSQKGKLSSPCHPIYTELYQRFYNKGIKFITSENIAMLDHPIGLACLYMDDGTLVIDSSGKHKKYFFPRIAIYTLSFTKEENEILIEHIYKQFHIGFKLKSRPDGNKYILELNKRNQVFNFLEIVRPFTSQVDCMSRKVDLTERMDAIKRYCEYTGKHKEISIGSNKINSKYYPENDEKVIIDMKLSGKTDKEIAKILCRSYWGIVDKIRRLRQEGRLHK